MRTRLPNLNEQALRMFLTGEATTDKAIACRLKVKATQVASWRKSQDWAGCKTRMQTLVQQGLLQRLGPISAMNEQHLRLWGLVLIAAGKALATHSETLTDDDLKSIEEALSAAGRGIRLAGRAA